MEDVAENRKVARLIAAEGTKRVVEMDDGIQVERTGGTVSWRNNNPGNLKFEYADSADKTVHTRRTKEQALASAQSNYDGVVGLDQWGNAVFETYEAGHEAKIKLLRGMGDKTVPEMLGNYSKADYSGGTHHQAQEKAIYAAGDQAGVDLRDKKIKHMSEQELGALADGIRNFEGWKEGLQNGVPAHAVEQQAGRGDTDQPHESHRGDGVRTHSHGSTPVAMRQGSHGENVRDMQSQLSELGYTDARGRALRADADFGPSTRAAVEVFQRDQGLQVDGTAGPKTMNALRSAREQQSPQITVGQAVLRLDQPGHPDHALFQQARNAVHQLDAQQGRASDQQSENLAAALTVAARAQGLERIDQVALSDDASRVWAVQRPPGVRDHFFDQHASVDTVAGVSTPVEQTSAAWPAAMQQFQQGQAQQEQAQSQVQQQAGPTMQR